MGRGWRAAVPASPRGNARIARTPCPRRRCLPPGRGCVASWWPRPAGPAGAARRLHLRHVRLRHALLPSVLAAHRCAHAHAHGPPPPALQRGHAPARAARRWPGGAGERLCRKRACPSVPQPRPPPACEEAARAQGMAGMASARAGGRAVPTTKGPSSVGLLVPPAAGTVPGAATARRAHSSQSRARVAAAVLVIISLVAVWNGGSWYFEVRPALTRDCLT